jgi:hypothetical protein
VRTSVLDTKTLSQISGHDTSSPGKWLVMKGDGAGS